MADFSKEEIVAFEEMLAGFNDALVMSLAVNKFTISPTTAERAQETIWRPMPYIVPTFEGLDQTGNFQSLTQLSVPSSLSTLNSAPWELDAFELRDMQQNERIRQGCSAQAGFGHQRCRFDNCVYARLTCCSADQCRRLL